MNKYEIKTEKFNIFTGTRAEAIVADLGTKGRVVCGHMAYVLPALATLKDLDLVDYRYKDVPLNVVLDALRPELPNSKFISKQFFQKVLSDMYGVNVAYRPVTPDPTILVLGMDDAGHWETPLEKELHEDTAFMDDDSNVLPGIEDLLLEYPDALKVAVYNGSRSANPAGGVNKRIIPYIDSYVNCKGHNAFFNSYLQEMIENEGSLGEIVIVGGSLSDQVLYTAIGAKDLDYSQKVTVIPDCCYDGQPKLDSVPKNILKRHIKDVLGVSIKAADPATRDISAKGAISILME